MVSEKINQINGGTCGCRDTLGLWASYDRKYHRTASFWPMYRLERELTADRVPSKFRDLYNGGAQPVQHTQLCPHRHRFDGHLPPRIIIDSANVSCKCAAQVNTIHFQ